MISGTSDKLFELRFNILRDLRELKDEGNCFTWFNRKSNFSKDFKKPNELGSCVNLFLVSNNFFNDISSESESGKDWILLEIKPNELRLFKELKSPKLVSSL